MKRILHAFVMCQSMFCAIPCPSKIWDEKARPLMLLFLPVVGLEMGLIWAGLAWACRHWAVPKLAAGMVLCAYSYLVTGFIHLDGFMDVKDAVGSYRSQEERKKILKDSHVGSFAVIGCVLLLLADFAFLSSASGDYRILILIPVVSRCGSSLAVTLLRPISVSQYAGAFKEGVTKEQPVILAVMLAAAVAVGFLMCGRLGFALVGEIIVYLWALHKGVHSLGGMNGDISGYALSLSELAAVAIFAFL